MKANSLTRDDDVKVRSELLLLPPHHSLLLLALYQSKEIIKTTDNIVKSTINNNITLTCPPASTAIVTCLPRNQW